MSLTGNENHDISLSEAADLTKNYRNTISTGATIAHYIGKSAIQSLLNQSNTVGVRIYYGLNADGSKELVATGVNQSGDDQYQGILLDRTIKCPQECSASNPLNTNVTS